MEAELHAGINRTVGKGLRVEKNTDLSTLIPLITEYIEAFETQSGTPEERQQEEVLSTRIQVFIRTNLNYDGNLQTPIGAKEFVSTSRKGALSNSQLLAEIAQLQTQSTERLVQAIKSTQPSLLSGVNWTPIVQGLTNVVITSLGGQPVSFPTSPAAPAAKTAVQAPGEAQGVIEQIKALESRLESRISTLESAITAMAQSQTQLTDVVTNTSSQLSSLAQALESFIKAQTSSKDPQGVNGGGTSSAPASPVLSGNVIKTKNGVKTTILEMEGQKASDVMAALHAENMKAIEQVEETKEHFCITGAGKFNLKNRIEELGFDPFLPPPSETENYPTEQTAMTTMKPIEKLEVEKETINFTKNIVCADLEALITPLGKNHVYMAAWYNGTKQNIFDITQWGMPV
ncbi:unnamed protein product [Rhizophagus irregularis]|nr:unnamed protein product [Rhizophagus irregularis]